MFIKEARFIPKSLPYPGAIVAMSKSFLSVSTIDPPKRAPPKLGPCGSSEKPVLSISVRELTLGPLPPKGSKSGGPKPLGP